MNIGEALNLVAGGQEVRRPVATGEHLHMKMNRRGELELGITQRAPATIAGLELLHEICWSPEGLTLVRSDLLAEDWMLVPVQAQGMDFPTAIKHLIKGSVLTRPDCDGSPIHYRMGPFGPQVGYKNIAGVFRWHNEPFDHNDMVAETYCIDLDPPDGPEVEE